jgi:hypothetical protein
MKTKTGRKATQKSRDTFTPSLHRLVRIFRSDECRSIGMYACTSKDQEVTVVIAAGGHAKRLRRWLRRA